MFSICCLIKGCYWTAEGRDSKSWYQLRSYCSDITIINRALDRSHSNKDTVWASVWVMSAFHLGCLLNSWMLPWLCSMDAQGAVDTMELIRLIGRYNDISCISIPISPTFQFPLLFILFSLMNQKCVNGSWIRHYADESFSLLFSFFLLDSISSHFILLFMNCNHIMNGIPFKCGHMNSRVMGG